jgi:hypothetical protein
MKTSTAIQSNEAKKPILYDLDSDFDRYFFTAQGMTSLLFAAVESEKIAEMDKESLLSATYSLIEVINGMKETFYTLYENSFFKKQDSPAVTPIKKEATQNRNIDPVNLMRALFEATWRMENSIRAIKKSIKENDLNTVEALMQDFLFDTGLSAAGVSLECLSDLSDTLKISINPKDDEDFDVYKKTFESYLPL